MANSYYYSNTAQPTTLSGSISAGATTITVGATTGFPGSFPYTLALDYGAGTEELVKVTAAAALNLTVERGFSGTSAQSHSLGAVVRHVHHAGDATDFRTHEAAASDVHGVTGALVGATQAQTLTNKTLTSPTINNGTYSSGGALSGTFTGTPTFSGDLTFTGGPNFTTTAPTFLGAASTTETIQVTVGGDSVHRFAVEASGALSWGSGSATRDTTLYRAASGILATDDTLRIIGASANDDSLAVRITGDTLSRLLIEADGGLSWGDGTAAQDVGLERTAAETLSVLGDLAVTGDLSVTGIGRMLPGVKTGDTARTSTTTVTADPHLTVSVAANATYTIEGALFYTSASVTPDFQMLVSGPAGSSGYWTLAAPSAGSSGDPDFIRTVASAIGSGRGYGVPVAAGIFGGNLFGTLKTAGTAGTCAVEWSQFTSDATSTTLKEHSWIRLTRVA